MFLQTVSAAIKAKKYAGRYIPVFMATNDNYAPFLGVTLNSLLLNADRYYFYDIYIFHSGIKEYYISKLDSIQEKDADVRCVNVKSIITSQNLYSNRHYSVEMYHRFLIPELFFFHGRKQSISIVTQSYWTAFINYTILISETMC